MIKKALLVSFIFMSASMAASSPCPTCPKGYVNSALQEALAANEKNKDQPKPPLTNLLPPTHFGENNPQNSPVQMITKEGQCQTFQKQNTTSQAHKFRNINTLHEVMDPVKNMERFIQQENLNENNKKRK